MSEFFETTSWECTKEEAEEIKRQEWKQLTDLLNGWRETAYEVLEKNDFAHWTEGYRLNPGTLVPEIIPSDIAQSSNAEVADAWNVLMEISRVEKQLCIARHSDNPVERFEAATKLAYDAIGLGITVSSAHVRPFEIPAVSGRKVRDGGRKGSEIHHGTPEQREQRRKEYKIRYDQLHELHTDWNNKQVTDEIGKEFGVTGRTVREHTPNTISPRQQRKKFRKVLPSS